MRIQPSPNNMFQYKYRTANRVNSGQGFQELMNQGNTIGRGSSQAKFLRKDSINLSDYGSVSNPCSAPDIDFGSEEIIQSSWSCIDGSGYAAKIDEASTEEDPIIYILRREPNGDVYEERIHVNDVDPRNATKMEIRAAVLYGIEKGDGSFSADDMFMIDLAEYYTPLSSMEKVDYTKMALEQGNAYLKANLGVEGNKFMTLHRRLMEFLEIR